MDHNMGFYIGKMKIVEKAVSNDFTSNFSIKAFQKITLINNCSCMKVNFGVTNFQEHRQRISTKTISTPKTLTKWIQDLN